MPTITHGPALVSSCAQATTAKEASFRIDYPLAAARNTRVVAMDPGALVIVRAASTHEWSQAKFYSVSNMGHDLVSMDGERLPLEGEIADSNTVIMVATTGVDAEASATIGLSCRARGITTAGLVVTPGRLTSDALRALRPHARILLVPAEADDLIELLRATRA